MYQVKTKIDELGGVVGSGSLSLCECDTLDEAAKYVRQSVIPGIRGLGCFTIEHNSQIYYVNRDGSTFTI